jgi:hypothetical protein
MDMEILRWGYPFSLAGTVNIFLRHAEFCGDKYVDEGLIFCQVDGRRIHPRNFTRHFDKVIEDAGIAHIAFHADRCALLHSCPLAIANIVLHERPISDISARRAGMAPSRGYHWNLLSPQQEKYPAL